MSLLAVLFEISPLEFLVVFALPFSLTDGSLYSFYASPACLCLSRAGRESGSMDSIEQKGGRSKTILPSRIFNLSHLFGSLPRGLSYSPPLINTLTLI